MKQALIKFKERLIAEFFNGVAPDGRFAIKEPDYFEAVEQNRVFLLEGALVKGSLKPSGVAPNGELERYVTHAIQAAWNLCLSLEAIFFSRLIIKTFLFEAPEILKNLDIINPLSWQPRVVDLKTRLLSVVFSSFFLQVAKDKTLALPWALRPIVPIDYREQALEIANSCFKAIGLYDGQVNKWLYQYREEKKQEAKTLQEPFLQIYKCIKENKLERSYSDTFREERIQDLQKCLSFLVKRPTIERADDLSQRDFIEILLWLNQQKKKVRRALRKVELKGLPEELYCFYHLELEAKGAFLQANEAQKRYLLWLREPSWGINPFEKISYKKEIVHLYKKALDTLNSFHPKELVLDAIGQIRALRKAKYAFFKPGYIAKKESYLRQKRLILRNILLLNVISRNEMKVVMQAIAQVSLELSMMQESRQQHKNMIR